MDAMEDDDSTQPRSELPYDAWTEDALRAVAQRALLHAAEHGLPGEHHFYITFRTDYPGVVIPARLRAKYPQEMTIVLQHQFWDLNVEAETARFSVGLSFGGVSSTLVIPFAALTGFADPHVRFALRFSVEAAAPAESASAPAAAPEPPEPQAAPPAPQGPAEVVSLDTFRRRKD
jgi:hypothetical protein